MTLQPIMPLWAIATVFTPIVGLLVYLIIIVYRHDRRKWTWLRRLFLVVLTVISTLGVSVPGKTYATGNSLLDVYFLFDQSYSAKALDYDGGKERLEGMRHDVKAIANSLVGADFNLILFDSVASAPLPKTSDISALETVLNTTAIRQTESTISAPIQLTEQMLRRDYEKKPHRGRIVFYFGDGEQTADKPVESFERLKPFISGGAILGYGTESGGKMHDKYWGTKLQIREFIPDNTAKDSFPLPDAISKINETNLRNIGKQAGLQYFHRTKPDEISDIIKKIEITKVIERSTDSDYYDNLTWLIAPFMIILSAIDGWVFHTSDVNAKKLREVNDEESTI